MFARGASRIPAMRMAGRPARAGIPFSPFSTKAPDEPTEADVRLVVLETALLHVPEKGWSTEALAFGAESAGYPAMTHGVFTRGPIELVEYFMESAALETARQVDEQHAELFDGSVSEEERLQKVVELRLRLLAPYISTWSQAMALGLLPHNAPTTLRNLALLSDEICHAAGRSDTDIRWYTNRSSVLALYSACEVFMLTDTSADFVDTWDFLGRRIAGMESTLAQLKKAADGGGGGESGGGSVVGAPPTDPLAAAQAATDAFKRAAEGTPAAPFAAAAGDAVHSAASGVASSTAGDPFDKIAEAGQAAAKGLREATEGTPAAPVAGAATKAVHSAAKSAHAALDAVGLSAQEGLSGAKSAADAAVEGLRGAATHAPGGLQAPLNEATKVAKSTAQLAFGIATSMVPQGAPPQMPTYHEAPSYPPPAEDDPSATTEEERAEFAPTAEVLSAANAVPGDGGVVATAVRAGVDRGMAVGAVTAAAGKAKADGLMK